MSPTRRRPGRQVRPGEPVAAVLVRVAHDHAGIAARPQDAPELGQGHGHPVEERGIVGAVGEVGRVLGDHRVVGPPVRVRLGQRSAGHRERQLDVVGRVGGDEVDRAVGQRRAGRARASPTRISQPDGSNERTPGRVDRPEVGEERARAVALGEQVADDVGVDRRPARLELDAQRAPRSLGDGRAEERAADPGERIEDQLAGPGEELDEPGHEPRRLVRAVPLALGMTELGRVGRAPDRLREVEPLLAGQLVQRVAGVRGATGGGHRGKPSPAWVAPGRLRGRGRIAPDEHGPPVRVTGGPLEKAVREERRGELPTPASVAGSSRRASGAHLLPIRRSAGDG